MRTDHIFGGGKEENYQEMCHNNLKKVLIMFREGRAGTQISQSFSLLVASGLKLQRREEQGVSAGFLSGGLLSAQAHVMSPGLPGAGDSPSSPHLLPDPGSCTGHTDLQPHFLSPLSYPPSLRSVQSTLKGKRGQ